MASRSGMMHGMVLRSGQRGGQMREGFGQAEAQGAIVRSGQSPVAAISAWPKPSRAAKRRMLATASRASTGEPS